MTLKLFLLDRGKANLDFDILQLYIYKKTDRDINVKIRQHISGCLKNFAKNGVPNINQTHVQLKEVIINKLMKLDKVFTLLWNEELLFTKYKQNLFVRNSVTSNTNSLPSSWEQPMIQHSFDAMHGLTS